jgi:hypothetical protein
MVLNDSFVADPIFCDTTSPFLKIASVGILKTLYFCASSLFSSTFILTKSTLPLYSLESSSTTGDTALHGPHHSAQKSTKTGLAEFRTYCSNCCEFFISFTIIFSPLDFPHNNYLGICFRLKCYIFSTN